jgi:hypothetical protein
MKNTLLRDLKGCLEVEPMWNTVDPLSRDMCPDLHKRALGIGYGVIVSPPL